VTDTKDVSTDGLDAENVANAPSDSVAHEHDYKRKRGYSVMVEFCTVCDKMRPVMFA
jgi:hypothetical protein